jgi:hypothetical protein
MADVYDTLSPTDQATVRTKLFALVSTNPCPTVDTSSIKSADALVDPADRGLAVDCFQIAKGLPTGGVFDQKTYSTLVGWWPSRTKFEKGAVIAGGVGAVALAWYGIRHAKKKRRLKA